MSFEVINDRQSGRGVDCHGRGSHLNGLVQFADLN